MIDTIEFYLRADELNNSDYLNNIPPLLNKFSTTAYENGNYAINGWYKGFKVSLTPSKINFKQGSICKYHLGDNQQVLRRGDFERAIQQLSDELHLPINKAHCTRLDFGHNIIMNYNPEIYLKYLGDLQYFQRLPLDHGLYYNNSIKQIIFYNKIHEQKIKGYYVKPILANQHILRYEYRLTKRLPQYFNLHPVLIENIYDESNYIKLASHWTSEYFRIKKINSFMKKIPVTGSTKKFSEMLNAQAIELLGMDFFKDMFDEWQMKSEISTKQKHDLKRYLRRISQNKRYHQENDLIKELDKKIMEEAYLFR